MIRRKELVEEEISSETVVLAPRTQQTGKDTEKEKDQPSGLSTASFLLISFFLSHTCGELGTKSIKELRLVDARCLLSSKYGNCPSLRLVIHPRCLEETCTAKMMMLTTKWEALGHAQCYEKIESLSRGSEFPEPHRIKYLNYVSRHLPAYQLSSDVMGNVGVEVGVEDRHRPSVGTFDLVFRGGADQRRWRGAVVHPPQAMGCRRTCRGWRHDCLGRAEDGVPQIEHALLPRGHLSRRESVPNGTRIASIC